MGGMNRPFATPTDTPTIMLLVKASAILYLDVRDTVTNATGVSFRDRRHSAFAIALRK